MLTVTFELTQAAAEQPVHGLSRGHMSFSNGDKTITSKSKNPDQSMFIFPSIVLLLDQLRPFLTTASTRRVHVQAIDSSFGFDARRTADGKIAFAADGIEFEAGTPREVASAIWDATSKFVSQFLAELQKDELVSDDLRSSMREFRDALPLVS